MRRRIILAVTIAAALFGVNVAAPGDTHQNIKSRRQRRYPRS